MEIKHYAKFFYPGAFMAEQETKEVNSRDIKEIKIPRNCIGVAIFDKLTQEVEYNDKKVKLESKEVDLEYYPVGKILTLEEVANKYGKNSIAYNNFKNNNYKHALETSNGSLTWLDEVDVDFVIDPNTLEYENPNEME